MEEQILITITDKQGKNKIQFNIEKAGLELFLTGYTFKAMIQSDCKITIEK